MLCVGFVQQGVGGSVEQYRLASELRLEWYPHIYRQTGANTNRRSLAFLAFGLIASQSAAPAQTAGITPPVIGASDRNASTTGVVAGGGSVNSPEYTPLTASERWRRYFVSAFGPGAILRAAAVGGIEQWEGTPKEWRGGAEAYGERFGNAYAEHIIRKTLESGAAAALHEDNRYFPSTETGFWKRTKHAVGSVFVSRNDAGQEHFAYSRFGSTIGTSFISRIWQPQSEDTSGDAAMNFGLTIAADMGWNVFKEFCPRHFRRQ